MTGARLTVLHVSDFQCGTPFLPDAAKLVHQLAAEVEPDVVVASGDLTQRAKRSEFEQARSVLDGFGDLPVVVTPGNHDVPLYRSWERFTDPFRNWRRFAGRSELDTVVRVEGATFVALNSAAPTRAIVNGRLEVRQLEFARRSFADSPPDDLRIVVVHHHFVPVEGGDGGATLPYAGARAAELEAMGVDAVLGGHVHQLHLRTSHDVPGAPGTRREPPLPILATGTATSRRGRGPEAACNSLCLLRFEEDEVEVTPYRRKVGGGEFEAVDPSRFGLWRGGTHLERKDGRERGRAI